MNKLGEDFLRPYTENQINQLMTLSKEMVEFGLSPEDVVLICEQYMYDMRSKMVDFYPKNILPPEEHPVHEDLNLPTCPHCGSALTISPVNVSKCTAVGGNYHTSLMCDNHDCRFTELSYKTVEEWRVDNVL